METEIWTRWTHENAVPYSIEDLHEFRRLAADFIKNNPRSSLVSFQEQDLIDLDTIIADRENGNG